MTRSKGYLVKEVAQLTGVSVRTLHYYDSIGLMVPSGRTAAGYRKYSEADLLRLQQIMLSRLLGLPLEEIRRSLDDPGFDLAGSLRRQRALLVSRLDETHRIIASIDLALARLAGETREELVSIKDIFDGFDPEENAAEAGIRWGETAAYQESARRAQRYGEAEWHALKAEQDRIWSAAADAMTAGATADSDAAIDIAREHRQHIERWFYPLMLADLWESDPRFEERGGRG